MTISTQFSRENREEKRGCCREKWKGKQTGCERQTGLSPSHELLLDDRRSPSTTVLTIGGERPPPWTSAGVIQQRLLGDGKIQSLCGCRTMARTCVTSFCVRWRARGAEPSLSRTHRGWVWRMASDLGASGVLQACTTPIVRRREKIIKKARSQAPSRLRIARARHFA